MFYIHIHGKTKRSELNVHDNGRVNLMLFDSDKRVFTILLGIIASI